MRLADRYILLMAVTYAFTTFCLSFYAASGLDLYVSLYIVEFLALTPILYSPSNGKTQKIINFTSYGLFAVFIVIVALRVLQVLVGILA